MKQVVHLAQKGDVDKIAPIYSVDMVKDLTQYRDAIAKDLELNAREGGRVAASSVAIYQSARYWIIGALLLVTFLCIGVAFVVREYCWC